MRRFQKILHELKDVVLSHEPGDELERPASMPTIELDGRKVAYVTGGDNEETPPVVLLHGFGGFFMDWPRVMMPVARHTRVYAIDLPGWGFSDFNENTASIEDDVRVVNQFLKTLGLNNVILCGISYGAGVAWAAAAMGLPRVRRAVLLNPMPPHPIRHMRSPLYQGIFLLNANKRVAQVGHALLQKQQYKQICRENLLNDRLLDTFYLNLAYMVTKQPKTPLILHAHAKGARRLNWNDWERRLSGIRMPVTILQGREDRIFSLASAQHLHRLIPTSQLIEVAECGHAMVFDQHRKVSDTIIRCLTQLKSGKEAHELSEEDVRIEGRDSA